MSTKNIVALAVAVGVAVGLSGCSKTTYTYRCVDGFVSQSTSDATALSGCGTHGGAINKTPEITRSSYRSSSRSWRSRSSSRRSKSSSRKRR